MMRNNGTVPFVRQHSKEKKNVMSIHSTSNNPIRLSGNNALTQEGAQNISKALTPFAHDHGVSKSISKLDTIQPRTVKSIETSSAKAFFSSLADAICDICHNIRAFFSQSDETILAIKTPTDNLLTTLRQHQGEIKNLFDKAPNSNDAKLLREAFDMLRNTYNELDKKLNDGNKKSYNLAGDGEKYLKKIRDDIKEALDILEPNWKERGRHAVRQFGNDVQQGLQKVGNFFRNAGEKIYEKLPEDEAIEKQVNKFGKNAQKKINEFGERLQKFGNKIEKKVDNFFNS